MKNLKVKLKITIIVDAWFVGSRQQYVLTILLQKMVDGWKKRFWMFYIYIIFKRKYVQRSQWDYFIKGLWVFFNYFCFFIWNRFWMNFLQIFIKNTHSYPNILHVLCQSLLNKYENFKVCQFCQIMHFSFLNY